MVISPSSSVSSLAKLVVELDESLYRTMNAIKKRETATFSLKEVSNSLKEIVKAVVNMNAPGLLTLHG